VQLAVEGNKYISQNTQTAIICYHYGKIRRKWSVAWRMEDYSPLISAISSLLTVPTTQPDAAGVDAVRQQLQVAIDTLIIYVDNVLKNVNEPRFRKVKKTLPAFERRIGALPRAKAIFHLLGWKEGTGEEAELYVLEVTPETLEAVAKRLQFARGELERAKQELQQVGPKFVDTAGLPVIPPPGAGLSELGELLPQLEGVRFRIPPDWTTIKAAPAHGLAVFKSGKRSAFHFISK
jgi:hypothetical protein